MVVSTSRIKTDNAGKYMVQLAKHWSHKIPGLTYDDEKADIPFPMGKCAMQVHGGVLDVTLTAATVSDVERLEEIFAKHLERFAFRETVDISWFRPGD